ncbi:MAG: hypothetical protein JXQ75_17815 [Phycisphaerae bacterium]|nr:hypothetical protein [Phycisphaerae bacterium]
MKSEPVRETKAEVLQPQLVLWNAVPFEPILPVRRTSHIVRTRRVAAHLKLEYARNGWPKELVLLCEHKLKLVAEDITLAIITNAAEAECELPDEVRTPVRDTGTFRDSTLIWQGREDKAFVSARVTADRDREAIRALSTVKTSPAPAIAPEDMAMAQRTLQSGLVVASAPLPEKMTPEDRELANYLLAYKDPVRRIVHSLVEIGRHFHCSDETIRRRMHGLFRKYPEIESAIHAVRSRNRKGMHPSMIQRTIRPAPDDAPG